MPTLTTSMVAESAALLPRLVWASQDPDSGGADPFFEAFPLADRDAWEITWDQEDNPYGLLPQGALDTPPVLMMMAGVQKRTAIPGVYRGYTTIRESQLTTQRELGTLAEPIKVASELSRVMRYFADMTVRRLWKIYADLGVNGQINNTDYDGNQHTYQIDGYQKINVSAWAGSPTTATPIDDLRAAQTTLNKGTSSRFGQKSKLLMTDEAVTTLLATTQIRNTFRSAYGASFMAPFDNNNLTGVQPPINGDQSLNKLFFGMGLPEIVPWNRGYYPDLVSARDEVKANWAKFLPTTSAVWIGYRPNKQPLGQLTFARHAGHIEEDVKASEYGVLGVKDADFDRFGKNIYVRAKYINEMPHHYKFEIGMNVCPEVWYNDALAAVNWS